MASSLPEFEQPPLSEVALGVQFDKLESLLSPHIGLTWQTFRERFPKTAQHAPLDPVFEQFGLKPSVAPGIRLELLSAPPTPRIWFLNEAETELVQIQQDRFVRNWRKTDELNLYPRYQPLRQLFLHDFQQFVSLVEREGWGQVTPNQCEVTYVNLIPAGAGWQLPGDLEKVITFFKLSYSDSGLGPPEEVAMHVKYIFNDPQETPAGRLHITCEPMARVSDGQAALRLSLTARGRPQGTGIDGVLRFFDHGHEVIVRGFASITTSELHRIWKRIDEPRPA